MKIRIITSIGGLDMGFGDFSFAPGDTPTLPSDTAQSWIAAGIAETVDDPASDPKKKAKK